jgi:hypothetical protein
MTTQQTAGTTGATIQNAATTANVFTGRKLETVTGPLAVAAEHGATMLAQTKAAARAAAEQIDANVPAPDAVKAVCALYSAELKALTMEAQTTFRDALLLLACPKVPVSFTTKGADGKETEKHTTAAAALDSTRAELRGAAKQVRESLGIARASGGGRKPGSTKAVPEQEGLAFAAWLHNLGEYLKTPEHGPQVVARLGELGYVPAAQKHGNKKKPVLTLSTPLV